MVMPKMASRLLNWPRNAGSDMDMESYHYVKYLEGLVDWGAVDEALINDAVKRILRVKFELGLFDDPLDIAIESVRNSL